MGLTVLVVDDATFIRDLVKRAVRQMVGEVELLEAADGARAQALIKQKAPDLILSDWEMPEVSGEELLKWVRAQPNLVATPFIMITSRGDRNHVIAAVNAGVSDYISKPFTAEELSRKVHKQLKRIGFSPKAPAAKPAGAFSSLEVLTGATAERSPKAAPKPAVAAAFAKPVAAPSAAPAKVTLQAHLRLAKQAFVCEVKEISLQAMSGLIDRTETLPQLFEVAALDILDAQGQVLARLNVYIHALTAASLSPESDKVRVMVRFVDQDPAKLAALSQWIQR
ncbi:MAG TPA: response regulator [Cellvibrionaceae bacterium]|nr:response regulator [Cellvibrionaceae bacterium]HMW72554.1 response regulator [Cellvibrionaceae bacterium]HMY38092.1 response regulator [Marinagarivorans sp.]HNG61046.1 response regulator [Cellvibrionaceae bacterium]